LNYDVVDNFLSKDEFQYIKNTILDFENCRFPWYYQSSITHEDSNDGFYFTHSFFSLQRKEVSGFFDILEPILNKINPKQLIRAKANLFIKDGNEIIVHDYHKDYQYEHRGCIFYLNNNNGYTRLYDDIRIECIENRMLFFEPHLLHSSTTCTDTKIRSNINFNYF